MRRTAFFLLCLILLFFLPTGPVQAQDEPSGQNQGAQAARTDTEAGPAAAPETEARAEENAGSARAPEAAVEDRADAADGEDPETKARTPGKEDGEAASQAAARKEAPEEGGETEESEALPFTPPDRLPAALRSRWPGVDSMVSSPFSISGQRGRRFHTGLDIRAKLGWPVRSLKKGVVQDAGPMGLAGLCVRVKQEDGKTVSYAHLGKILVTPGQKVARGQHLGLVGCTGRTTGPHLHLTVRSPDGALLNPRREISALWEVFDPPAEEVGRPLAHQGCPRGQGLRTFNPRMRIGMPHYLRMRRSARQLKVYRFAPLPE